MTEPPQWIIDVLIILIPTVGGALTSSLSLNHWQAKKEQFQLEKQRYALRRKILDDYQKSIASRLVLSLNFVNKIGFHYSSPSELSSKEKKEIKYITVFPTEEEKKPLNQFSTELKEFNDKYESLNYEVWDFFSTLSVYFESEKIISKYTELSDTQLFFQKMIYVLLRSDNTDDFAKNFDILSETKADLINFGTEMVDLLANTPLKIPLK